jgi:hypothetical protein
MLLIELLHIIMIVLWLDVVAKLLLLLVLWRSIMMLEGKLAQVGWQLVTTLTGQLARQHFWFQAARKTIFVIW